MKPTTQFVRESRRADAKDRQTARAKLSPSAQIKELDRRGVTATKERARLAKLLKK